MPNGFRGLAGHPAELRAFLDYHDETWPTRRPDAFWLVRVAVLLGSGLAITAGPADVEVVTSAAATNAARASLGHAGHDLRWHHCMVAKKWTYPHCVGGSANALTELFELASKANTVATIYRT